MESGPERNGKKKGKLGKRKCGRERKKGENGEREKMGKKEMCRKNTQDN